MCCFTFKTPCCLLLQHAGCSSKVAGPDITSARHNSRGLVRKQQQHESLKAIMCPVKLTEMQTGCLQQGQLQGPGQRLVHIHVSRVAPPISTRRSKYLIHNNAIFLHHAAAAVPSTLCPEVSCQKLDQTTETDTLVEAAAFPMLLLPMLLPCCCSSGINPGGRGIFSFCANLVNMSSASFCRSNLCCHPHSFLAAESSMLAGQVMAMSFLKSGV